MRTAILVFCLLIATGTSRAELLQVTAIVNTSSTFFMAYEDNQVWLWGGPPQRLAHVDRGGIAIRDMKRWSTGEMVALLYEDEQIWAANASQFWFHVDAHRDGTQVLYMDCEQAPQIVCTYTNGHVWIWTDGVWRREESMEREVPVAPPPSQSVIRLAFYGWDSAPVACFDETVNDTLYCYLPSLVGPEFGGSVYHFGFISLDTDLICYIPGDTQPDSTCTYDITAWFEPGSVGIGHVVGPGGGDQSAMVEGQGWLGHVPTDFTHLRVQFDQRAPCYSTRTIAVPIHWFMDAPAGVEEDGFRAIAFPNPSSGVCVIPFHVPSEGPVSIDVVDVSGRIIRRLLQGSRPAGMHSVLWNGMGERNRPVPAGVYLTRISTTERTTTGRIVLTR